MARIGTPCRSDSRVSSAIRWLTGSFHTMTSTPS
jgi:hypothetical protein